MISTNGFTAENNEPIRNMYEPIHLYYKMVLQFSIISGKLFNFFMQIVNVFIVVMINNGGPLRYNLKNTAFDRGCRHFGTINVWSRYCGTVPGNYKFLYSYSLLFYSLGEREEERTIKNRIVGKNNLFVACKILAYTKCRYLLCRL